MFINIDFLLLFNKSTIDYATVNSTGTTIPYIKWNNYLEKMQLRLPPKEIASKYQELISPILEKLLAHPLEKKSNKPSTAGVAGYCKRNPRLDAGLGSSSPRNQLSI